MMLSPISNVRFGSGAAAAAPNDTTTTGILDRPGAFSKPLEGAPAKDEVNINNPGKAPKKKHSVAKALLTIGGIAVAVAAALVAGNKTGVLKTVEKAALENAGIMEKAGHYLSEAGAQIAKYTWEPLVGLFSKGAK